MTAETPKSVISQGRLAFDPFEIESEIRQAISHALKHSGQSREWVAATIQELAKQTCTSDTLHNWCAPSKANWRIPACAVPAFCWATQDTQVFEIVGKPIKSMLIGKRLEELSRAHEERARWERRIAELEGRL